MTFEEFIAMLSGMPKGADLVAFANKMNDDNIRQTNSSKATRTALKTAEDGLKALKTNYDKVLSHIGLEGDVEDLETALSDLGTKKTKDTDLQVQLNKFKAEMKKAKEDADSLIAIERNKRHDAMRSQAITAALAAGNAKRPEELATLIAKSITIGDDDSMIFTDDKGSELSVADGIKAWLTARPEFVGNSQQPGSGSAGGNGSTGGSNDFAKNLAAENSKVAEVASKGQEVYFG